MIKNNAYEISALDIVLKMYDAKKKYRNKEQKKIKLNKSVRKNQDAFCIQICF
jgi:hypothetical protein